MRLRNSTLKKIIASLYTLFMLLTCLTSFVYAQNDTSANVSEFRDIKSDHWAYEAITRMVEKKVISGYPDGTFKPDNEVSRAEFAKMMVLALNLPLRKPETASFKDVRSNDWEYQYIETAKYYLTGFRTTQGDYFRSNSPAVREDMAVALIKAMGYTNEAADESVLSAYSDSQAISSSLKKYVAAATKLNIMQGYPEGNNSKLFKPQGPLTRAEAATLLSKLMKEEKVTYETDEVKVTPPDEPYTTSDYTIPNVSVETDGGRLIVRWQQISDSRFQGYKVVISKYNSSPKYPDDGYLYWITDRARTYAIIDNHDSYNGGDFGKYLIPGENYYISVTALYDDARIPGNTVTATYPRAH